MNYVNNLNFLFGNDTRQGSRGNYYLNTMDISAMLTEGCDILITFATNGAPNGYI